MESLKIADDSTASTIKAISMYRLMKSVKLTLNHIVSGSITSYRYIRVKQFPELNAAIKACEHANKGNLPYHYVLNHFGKEYYSGEWID